MTDHPHTDELDDHVAESMEDPAYRGADADHADRLSVVARLVDLRKAAGLRQGDVAEQMGTWASFITEFEHPNSDPRLSTIQRYARVVGARVTLDARPTLTLWVTKVHSGPSGGDLTLDVARTAIGRRPSTPVIRNHDWTEIIGRVEIVDVTEDEHRIGFVVDIVTPAAVRPIHVCLDPVAGSADVGMGYQIEGGILVIYEFSGTQGRRS